MSYMCTHNKAHRQETTLPFPIFKEDLSFLRASCTACLSLKIAFSSSVTGSSGFIAVDFPVIGSRATNVNMATRFFSASDGPLHEQIGLLE